VTAEKKLAESIPLRLLGLPAKLILDDSQRIVFPLSVREGMAATAFAEIQTNARPILAEKKLCLILENSQFFKTD
jgi:hypothetical protein